ncbi:hypothetical protein MP638_002685 [Amoeboaphelidium occidentale]|nr:hypothetical protein MP638_002685 [Amoeboaphelidium occidentale]
MVDVISKLGSEFIKFLHENKIPLVLYRSLFEYFEKFTVDGMYVVPERYFMISPKHQEARSEIETKLLELFGDKLRVVTWAPGFYSLPGHVNLGSIDLYKEGKLLGMDASSAVAVHALDLQKGDHVLDLCCAPGTKLILMNSLVSGGNRDYNSFNVTGVDVSKHRLHTCQSLISKHNARNLRLFLGDGTLFGVGPVNTSRDEPVNIELPHSQKPFYCPKGIRNTATYFGLYDKVLVDTECTHDGSVAHIFKMLNSGGKEDLERFLDKERLQNLENLQRNLLLNGFKLLKPGGILVYSTCSFSVKQNELIVQWLLEQHSNAKLLDIDIDLPSPTKEIDQIIGSSLSDFDLREDLLTKTRRFHGCEAFFKNNSWWTSAFFLAKITKT